MQGLANILAGYAMQDFGTLMKRTKRNAILYVLASILALTAFAAALVGGGIYLAASFSPMGAAFLIAAFALAAAVTLLVVVLILNRIERRRRHAGKALAASAAITLLRHSSDSKTPLMLAAAGGLGYLALQVMGDGDASSK